MFLGMQNVLQFLITFILGFYAYAVLMRFFMQIVKADFYNPLSQALMKFTNPFVLRLRKFIPGLFNLDIASLFLVYLVFVVQNALLSLIYQSGFSSLYIFVMPIINTLFAILNLYIYLIIIRALSSWFTQGNYNPLLIAVNQLTEPLLYRVRKIIKPASGIDFSPMALLIILFCIQIFLQGVFKSFLF